MTLGQDIDLNLDDTDAYNASIYYEAMQEMEIPTDDPPTEQHPPTNDPPTDDPPTDDPPTDDPPTDDPPTEQVLSQGTQELISRAFK